MDIFLKINPSEPEFKELQNQLQAIDSLTAAWHTRRKETIPRHETLQPTIEATIAASLALENMPCSPSLIHKILAQPSDTPDKRACLVTGYNTILNALYTDARKYPLCEDTIVANGMKAMALRKTGNREKMLMPIHANANRRRRQPKWRSPCLPTAQRRPKVGQNSSMPATGTAKAVSNTDASNHPQPMKAARTKHNTPIKTKAARNIYRPCGTCLPAAFLPTVSCKYKDRVMITVPQTTSAKPMPIANPSMMLLKHRAKIQLS